MVTSRGIYIIDDDKDDQQLLIEAIAEIDPGIQCITAGNGEDGLKKIFQKQIPVPLVIFLDLNMPRVNGKETLAKLKNDPATASIRVIIYSTSSYDADISDCKRLGSYDYWVKDEDFNDLKFRIKNLLDQLREGERPSIKNPCQNLSAATSENVDRGQVS